MKQLVYQHGSEMRFLAMRGEYAVLAKSILWLWSKILHCCNSIRIGVLQSRSNGI